MILLNVSSEDAHALLLKLLKEGRAARNFLQEAADPEAIAGAGKDVAAWFATASASGSALFREGQHLARFQMEFDRGDRKRAVTRVQAGITEAERLERARTYDRRQLQDAALRIRDEAVQHLDALLDVLTKHLGDVEALLPPRLAHPQPRIFFSWQSDLPNSTNRGFIEHALTAAIKELAADASIDVAPRLDDAASGIAGAEDIAATIQRKIDEAAIFVGDVSIIGRATPTRATPNPNVLVETGYALKALGASRTIMVFNEHYGRLEDLPFDLRPRLAMRYRAAETEPGTPDPARIESRRGLARSLAAAMKGILAKHAADSAAQRAIAQREEEESRMERERSALELRRLQSENEIRMVLTQQGPGARSGSTFLTSFTVENHGETNVVIDEHYCVARPTTAYWEYVKHKQTDSILKFPTALRSTKVVKPGDEGQLALKITIESVRQALVASALPNPSAWHWAYLELTLVVKCTGRGGSREVSKPIA